VVYTIVMNRATKQSGYIGLLGLLISGAILIFIMFKVYLTPSKTISDLQPTKSDGTIPTNQFERNQATIDRTKAITTDAKAKADETNRIIESIQ